MAGVSFNTVSKLLLDIGEAAARYHDEHMRDLPCKAIEADEIWSFVGSKAKNVRASPAASSSPPTATRRTSRRSG
jgi:hypothetical protein